MAEDESCENRKLHPLILCKRLGTSRAYAERRGCARGGTERLNLPSEFMTELFKGCLVVLNPVTAALAFPSLPVSRFEPIVHFCFLCARSCSLGSLFYCLFLKSIFKPSLFRLG